MSTIFLQRLKQLKNLAKNILTNILRFYVLQSRKSIETSDIGENLVLADVV